MTIRQINDGALRCEHRNRTVCPACFAKTPMLVNVYGEVYKIEPELLSEYQDLAASAPDYIEISPAKG